jgi:hypothetical protein
VNDPCSVIYMICSKVLTNRLPVLLDDIILEEQSVFVTERLISHNVITAYEGVHSMKGKKGRASFSVD